MLSFTVFHSVGLHVIPIILHCHVKYRHCYNKLLYIPLHSFMAYVSFLCEVVGDTFSSMQYSCEW